MVCFFSFSTPVSNVTRCFRNHSNMLICCSRNICKCWKQRNIFEKSWPIFV